MSEEILQSPIAQADNVSGMSALYQGACNLAAKFWADERGCVLIHRTIKTVDSTGKILGTTTENLFMDCQKPTCNISGRNPANHGVDRQDLLRPQIQNNTFTQR